MGNSGPKLTCACYSLLLSRKAETRNVNNVTISTPILEVCFASALNRCDIGKIIQTSKEAWRLPGAVVILRVQMLLRFFPLLSKPYCSNFLCRAVHKILCILTILTRERYEPILILYFKWQKNGERLLHIWPSSSKFHRKFSISYSG